MKYNIDTVCLSSTVYIKSVHFSFKLDFPLMFLFFLSAIQVTIGFRGSFKAKRVLAIAVLVVAVILLIFALVSVGWVSYYWFYYDLYYYAYAINRASLAMKWLLAITWAGVVGVGGRRLYALRNKMN